MSRYHILYGRFNDLQLFGPSIWQRKIKMLGTWLINNDNNNQSKSIPYRTSNLQDKNTHTHTQYVRSTTVQRLNSVCVYHGHPTRRTTPAGIFIYIKTCCYAFDVPSLNNDNTNINNNNMKLLLVTIIDCGHGCPKSTCRPPVRSF